MEENVANGSAEASASNAVAIFGQGGAAGDEFPVLKAFQQYIDAEQAKARKRMLGLSVFFVVLLVVVVVTFVMVLGSVLNRNQALSDRLLDIALRERAPQQAAPVVVNQPQSQGDSLRPVLEQLAGLAAAMKERPAPAAAASEPGSAEQLARAERLRLERERIAVEREKLKQEREQARQAEVERQRRRLYPEYYAKLEREREAAAAAEKAIGETSAAAAVADLPASAPEGSVDFVMPVKTGAGTRKWHLPLPD